MEVEHGKPERAIAEDLMVASEMAPCILVSLTESGFFARKWRNQGRIFCMFFNMLEYT
jgi:hypothetical protein